MCLKKSSTAVPAVPAPRRLPALALFIVLWASNTRLVAQDEDLARRLDAALKDPALVKAQVGAAVVSVDGQTPLYLRNADQALTPASVMKLVTSGAFLLVHGPNFRFVTTLEAAVGALDKTRGVLRGPLWLVGRGDPNLSGRFHKGDGDAPFRALARQLRDQGVAGVEGDLICDASWFDDQLTHPNWEPADLDRWYGAPVAALSFNDNCTNLFGVPGKGVRTDPRFEAVDCDLAWTAKPGVRTNATVRRQGARIVVKGVVSTTGDQASRGPGPDRRDFPVPDPVGFTGTAMKRALIAEGIALSGTVRRRGQGETPPKRRTLARFESSLEPTLRVTNARSQNFYAECLRKGLAADETTPGSWKNGADLTSKVLTTVLGEAPRGIALDDGSGLSRDNTLSAAFLARWLSALAKDGHGALFFDTLSVAGLDGTMKSRLSERSVGLLLAKTGSLTGVDALAGAIGFRDRPAWVFAFLVNGASSGHGPTRSALDKLAETLVQALLSRPMAENDAREDDTKPARDADIASWRAWLADGANTRLPALLSHAQTLKNDASRAPFYDLAADVLHESGEHRAERRYTALALAALAGKPAPQWLSENEKRLAAEHLPPKLAG